MNIFKGGIIAATEIELPKHDNNNNNNNNELNNKYGTIKTTTTTDKLLPGRLAARHKTNAKHKNPTLK